MFKTARLLLRALVQPWLQPNIPDHIQALIVSPGGVGTTFVIEHVQKFKNTNDPYDRDRLKHLPRPSKTIAGLSDCCVLMITGEVASIHASLKRRGWDRIQSARLGCPIGVIGSPAMSKAAFEKAVQKQVESWGQAELESYMVVQYEDLWDRVDEIATFLRINDHAFVKDFPQRKRRLSKPKDATETVLDAAHRHHVPR